MRIGVLTTSFPRYAGDLAGHFVMESCDALAARGHTVEVLVPEAAGPRVDVPDARYSVTTIPYLRPRALQRTFYGAGVPDNLSRDPLAWLGLAPFVTQLALATAFHSRRWDAVISHWALPCSLVAALRPRDCRHLSVLHSADVHVLARLPGRRSLAAAMLASADHHWFTSRSLRSKFAECLNARARDRLHEQSSYGPMGVAEIPKLESRDILRARLGLDRFTVLVLARLVPVKGIEHAIGAVAGTAIDLVIAGDGPERARLQKLAAPFGAQVRFVGIVTGQTKHEWLAAVDVVALPSIVLSSGRTEGLPTVVLEAMSHGRPVIASDVGGIGDVVRHNENGLLLPARDVGALRSALLRLIDEPQTRDRIAHNGYASVVPWRWEKLAAKWESILRRDPAFRASPFGL